MTHHEPCQSPLLHQDMYVEEALRTSLRSYEERHRIGVEVTQEAKGWRITLIENGSFLGHPNTLLREIMNEMLVRSLASKLERITP